MSVYCVNTKKVSHDLLEDEVIAIHFETGAYYSMRGGAALVWENLKEPISPEHLATFFSGAGHDVTDRLKVFLDELVGDDLLLKQDQEDASPSGCGEWGPCPELTIEKYSDMQDLLLADPIHDVQTEEGWPYLKQDHGA